MTERRGIACGGNWIVDHVKTISFWPREETLANILAEELGTGGSAYNVLVDLARFQLDIPLSGVGLVGDDADGERILADLKRLGIDSMRVLRAPGAPTSYTDVMTVRSTGRRTFFHNRGANALLGPEHFPYKELSCRLFHLGYLLLLDKLDAEDPEFGTKAARVLAGLQGEGILTSIDVVSEDSDRFSRLVSPALPHADHAILNEIEAGRTTGHEIRGGRDVPPAPDDDGRCRDREGDMADRGDDAGSVGAIVRVAGRQGAENAEKERNTANLALLLRF